VSRAGRRGAGIARAGLKSLVEGVRLQTLGRAGLQQLQVDVHFLRPHLRRRVPGRAVTLPLTYPALVAAPLRHACACMRRPGAMLPGGPCGAWKPGRAWLLR
jgi:hypothetical protein